MRRFSPLYLVAVAVLAAGSSLMLSARADDAPASQPAAGVGSIKGTILKEDGSAFLGTAEVQLMPPPAPKHKKNAAPTADGPDTSSPAKKGLKALKTVKVTPDDKGIFTFKDVPAGKYSIVVNDRLDKLRGKEQATVTADNESDVTVTLHTPKPKKHAGDAPPAPPTPPAPTAPAGQ